MTDLNARQKFILNTIIEKGPLNIKDLSQQFDVSNRTISREMDVINKFLADKKVNIHENNSNIYAEGSEEDIKKLRHFLRDIPLQWLLSQEQRMILITAQLLVAEEPYKSAFFSYQFNVVEGTISLYMEKIEQWLNLRNLTLSRKRGYGISIEGPEWIKRNLFLEMLYEYKSIDELLAFVYGNKKDSAVSTFFKIIFDEKLIKTSKELLELVKTEMFNLDDMAYFSSYIYILLSLKKTRFGSSINLPSYLVHDVLTAGEFSFTGRIREYLSVADMEISDDELAYIAIQLMGHRYVYKGDRKFEQLGVSLEDISSEVVYEVSRRMNTVIECDEQLILGLSQHFSPALYRINMGIQVKNPLVDQIKEYYGELFKAVNYACKLVFSKYNITMPQDEIGYITMHIGAALERSSTRNNRLAVLVICPSGMGTARILSDKIKQSIPQIDKVTISSVKDWNESYDGFDLVLSTVNIDNQSNKKNIITVSPFLRKEDINRISEYIKTDNIHGRLFNNFTALSGVEREENLSEKYGIMNYILENIQLEVMETGSFTEILGSITDNLVRKALITDGEEVKNLIVNREEMGSVVVPGSHVALLHTRSDSVKSPFIGVYRLKENMVLKSIGFADESVDTFILLLARKSELAYSLEQMGKVSISLIESKDFTDVLRFGDIKDLRGALVKILNEEVT
ncbi:MAG: BglG family transcription antiterminator [Bacillota bacterium]|nr:BglG family transcription antiterminator [Bacillota bacterium]